MTLRKKLLTLDIFILLLFAIISITITKYGNPELLSKYFVVFMITAYYIGRHIPLKIVKKHLNQQK